MAASKFAATMKVEDGGWSLRQALGPLCRV